MNYKQKIEELGYRYAVEDTEINPIVTFLLGVIDSKEDEIKTYTQAFAERRETVEELQRRLAFNRAYLPIRHRDEIEAMEEKIVENWKNEKETI